MSRFSNLYVSGKSVLVRVDFNVPLDKNRNVSDDTRIRAAVPTIKSLLDRGAAIVLMSHLGRPQKKKLENGKLNKEKFSVAPAAAHLSKLLGIPVTVANDVVGPDAVAKRTALKPGEILMLENTRFKVGEEKGDEHLGAQFAAFGDVYVNDAFGTAHRAHASTTQVASHFEHNAKAFGMLMDKEIANARGVLDNPTSPVVAITGGAKVSDKVLLLEKLLDLADDIIIGGGMAYTFVKAKGGDIGNSLVELDLLDKALAILAKAEERGVGIHLPADNVCAQEFSPTAEAKVFASGEIPADWMGLDIGEKAQKQFDVVISKAKTVLWNGPMGVFEFEQFAHGTTAVANAVAAATKNGAYSLIGGGDSVAAIVKAGLEDQVSFVSTGGGALLEFLEGKTLPGVAAIEA
ncbi:MAG: phosphoglycerate kinase [Saprospiraceae bacterium]